jgi:hypothetical protein
MMITDNGKPKWFFYPGWVVLSVISIPIALAIYWVLISQIKKVVGDTILVGGQPHITEDFLLKYICFPTIGLLTGFLQYLLLRRYLPRMGWWIVATTLGWSLIFIGDRLLYRTLYTTLGADSIWFVALMVVLVSGSIGLPQWLVLRQCVQHAAWWILANVLGWGIAALVAGATYLLALSIIPAIAASVVLWLLLDRLPHQDDGRNAPLNPV